MQVIADNYTDFFLSIPPPADIGPSEPVHPVVVEFTVACVRKLEPIPPLASVVEMPSHAPKRIAVARIGEHDIVLHPRRFVHGQGRRVRRKVFRKRVRLPRQKLRHGFVPFCIASRGSCKTPLSIRNTLLDYYNKSAIATKSDVIVVHDYATLFARY